MTATRWLLLTAATALVSTEAAGRPSVVPQPASAVWSEGALPLDAGIDVRSTGFSNARLERALERFRSRVEGLTGIPAGRERDAPVLSVDVAAAGDHPESYLITVTPEGASLRADAVRGALHGLETLLQLVELDGKGFHIPAGHIEDEPRFPWRGLLLDPARHFLPVADLKRTLDAMAAVKLNVFHWHLTDDQGFRVESRLYPRLHLMGSNGDFYTRDDVRRIVRYASDRGIRVVPEIDVPGHATSWLVGYPELGSAPGPYELERGFGIQDPVLDPTNDAVYRFLDGLIGELAELFPDEYFHIGGDEVTGRHWNESPRIQAFLREKDLSDAAELQAHFNRRLAGILQKYEKRLVGWDEILHPSLPAGAVVQSWRGQASLAEAARRGFEGVLSFGYYLDHMFPASFHHAVDPLEGSGLSPEASSRVLGGEACLWGELVTPENLDLKLWPRAAAVADRLWAPADTPRAEELDERLARLSRYLDAIGLQHESSRRRLLKRLAGRHDPGSLTVLADVLEPLRFYARLRVREYRTDTPLNRLVDALRPESPIARELGRSAEPERMRPWLELWRANHEKLAPIIDDSALLTEVRPVSLALSRLAGVGLEALDALRAKRHPGSVWVERARREIAAAPGPDFTARDAMLRGSWPLPGTWWNDEKTALKGAEVEIAVLPAISALVERAATLER